MYEMLNTAFTTNGVMCVRYPRGNVDTKELTSNNTIEIGKANIAIKGKGIAIFAFGTTLNSAIEASKENGATVIDMRFVKPIDEKMILDIAKSHSKLISVEDNSIKGGAGSAINEVLNANNITNTVHTLGLPDEFTEQGSQDELYNLYGIDKDAIVSACKS